MLKFFIFFIFSVKLVFAGDYIHSAANIKQELGEENFLHEYKLFMPYKNKIKNLQKLEKNVFQEKALRFEILDKLLKYQKQSNSLIIAQYGIDEGLRYVNLKDVKKFKKYILPNAEVLYKRGMCDGYLFKGIYSQNIEGNSLEALKIYRQGAKNCTISWKKMNILSRMNKLRYRLGLIGKR